MNKNYRNVIIFIHHQNKCQSFASFNLFIEQLQLKLRFSTLQFAIYLEYFPTTKISTYGRYIKLGT